MRGISALPASEITDTPPQDKGLVGNRRPPMCLSLPVLLLLAAIPSAQASRRTRQGCRLSEGAAPLAAALAATAYYLGRRSAQAGLQARGGGRVPATEFPGEQARQEEAFRAPLLPVEASDEEDEATMRRDEGARSSWSFAYETFTDRFEARSRKLTRTVLVQGPVTYLRKRAQPRFQPLAEGMWGALVTTEEPASG